MIAEIQQLISRLQEGETFVSLLRSFLPRAEQELLKYCASVRIFDERMVDQIFRSEVQGGGKEAVPFSRLIEQPFVEQVAGMEGFYQLRESNRREYFELWHEGLDNKGKASDVPVAPKLKTLSERLVSYYQSLGPNWELDVLYQQIPANSKEAEKLFNRLYDAADSVFDLGRCQDLIKILEARNTILDPNLRGLLLERQYYLKARSLWSKEYYQTVYYYEIEELTKGFQALVQDSSKWIFHLHAPGGRGKTMFLRWLSSRRCVPHPHKIPCAKIDFDIIDPVMATQNPWMLLLELALQLNEQIPGNLFGDQLGDLKEFRPILTRTDLSPHGLSQTQTAQRSDQLDIPGRFVKALEAAKLNKKVVLIFDTLEEVILYQGTDMMALLGEIEKLRRSYPNICLILSGRYNLGDKLPGYSDKYAADTQTLELTPFGDKDASRYLTEKRGLTRLVKPVVAKAQGNPFRLALYADILRFTPNITENEIKKFPSDLLYLIRRVLLRIPDHRVRWLLRYGVIPRKLRLSFVKEVMAPFLPNAMSGKSSLDNPEKDLEKSLQGKPAFPNALKSPKQKVDVEKIWQNLNQYASSYSWVWPDEEANTLSFHPDVLIPMRRVLRKHKIYRRLHRAAFRHYEDKANADSKDWGRWIQEAIYHKFQLERGDAGVYWRQQLEHAFALQRPDWRLAFAREVINLAAQTEEAAQSEDLKVEKKEPVKPVVDKALLAQAHFEVARANVEIIRGSSHTVEPQDPLWQEANRAFQVSEQLLQEPMKSLVPPSRKAFVRSALLRNQGKHAEALSVLDAALRKRTNAKDKITLELEYAAELSLLSKHKESARHYRAALTLATRARVKTTSVLEIRKQLAQRYENAGEVKKAEQEYKTALDYANKTNSTMDKLELSRRLAEVYLTLGRLAEAHVYASTPAKHKLGNLTAEAIWESPARLELVQYLNLQGRLALAMSDPLTALQKSTENLKVVQRAISEGWQEQNLDRFSASAQELHCLVSAELMEYSQALDGLEQARSAWNEAKDTVGASRCLLHMLEIHLKVAGNVKAAKFLSEQVGQLNLQPLPELFLRQELLRIEVFNLLEKTSEAQKLLRNLAALSKQDKWSPKGRAAVALASMVQRAHKNQTVSPREAVAALRQVQPPSARLTLLDEMYLCPTPKRVSASLADSFRSLLPQPHWEKADGPVNALKIAETLRVVGKKLSPKSLLESAEERFIKAGNLFALRKVYLAWDRLGWPHKRLSDLAPRISEFLNTFSSHPNLCGSLLLEQAERLLTFGEFDAAQQTLESAGKYFEATASDTQWSARLNELRGRLHIERTLPRQARGTRIDKSQEATVRQGFKFLIQAKNIYDDLRNQAAVKRLGRYLSAARNRLESVLNAGKKGSKKKTKSAVARRATLLRTYERYAAQFAETVSLPKDTCVVQVRRMADTSTITVRTEYSGLSARPMRRRLNGAQLVPLIKSAPQGDIISKEFAEAFTHNWFLLSLRMNRILMEDAVHEKIIKQSSKLLIDFRLDVEDTLLAGLPWEFALLGTLPIAFESSTSPDTLPKEGQASTLLNSIRYMYRNPAADLAPVSFIRNIQTLLHLLGTEPVTVDGIYGPLTYKAVSAFQREHKLPVTGIADQKTIEEIEKNLRRRKKVSSPLRVLVVQTSSQRQIAMTRGHGVSGIDLPSLYTRNGFKVEVVENPTMDMLVDAMHGSPAQIIHLCPVMKRSLSVGIYLDFGSIGRTTKYRPSDKAGSWSSPVSSAATGEANFFSLTALGKLLDEFAHINQIRPLVILDVPRPPVISEAVIQLLLRNAFASDIYRMGKASAVLATGLAHLYEKEPLVKILTSSLAHGETLGDTVRLIRSRTLDYLGRLNRGQFDAPQTLGMILGYIGTALFTHNPNTLIH